MGTPQLLSESQCSGYFENDAHGYVYDYTWGYINSGGNCHHGFFGGGYNEILLFQLDAL
jgi:hypothetical protein